MAIIPARTRVRAFGMEHISVRELHDVLSAHMGDGEIDFIDVRTPEEYAREHVIGVRNVPLNTLREHVHEFGHVHTVYVLCRSGGRSTSAISLLVSLGVTAHLVNVDGGIHAWSDAGFPVASSESGDSHTEIK